MALKTRCLECENFTEREEKYQDLSVPINKRTSSKQEGDDSDDEGKLNSF